MAGYCEITDVVALFPSFQRDAPNSVTDEQIQNWIDRGASLINAVFFQKGIDLKQPLLPSGLPLSADQTNLLLDRNEDYAASKLGAVLEANVTLQPGEISVAGQRRKVFETFLAEVKKGQYDAYFGITSTIAESWGGAEVPRGEPRGDRFFGKNEDY